MSSGQATASVPLRNAKAMRYVARQPIFEREEKVFGYELLFLGSLENCFVGDAYEASRATLDRSLVMGLDVLCDGRRAFVNCTRDTLIKGLVGLLPSTTTVVEILETVPPDPDVMAACHSLKEQGCMMPSTTTSPTTSADRLPRWPTSSRLTGCLRRKRSVSG